MKVTLSTPPLDRHDAIGCAAVIGLFTLYIVLLALFLRFAVEVWR